MFWKLHDKICVYTHLYFLDFDISVVIFVGLPFAKFGFTGVNIYYGIIICTDLIVSKLFDYHIYTFSQFHGL